MTIEQPPLGIVDILHASKPESHVYGFVHLFIIAYMLASAEPHNCHDQCFKHLCRPVQSVEASLTEKAPAILAMLLQKVNPQQTSSPWPLALLGLNLQARLKSTRQQLLVLARLLPAFFGEPEIIYSTDQLLKPLLLSGWSRGALRDKGLQELQPHLQAALVIRYVCSNIGCNHRSI